MSNLNLNIQVVSSLAEKSRLSTVANFINRGLVKDDWLNVIRENLKEIKDPALSDLFEVAVILGQTNFLPGSNFEVRFMELCDDHQAKIDVKARAQNFLHEVITAKKNRDDEIDAELGL
jgi:hypothetical protein